MHTRLRQNGDVLFHSAKLAGVSLLVLGLGACSNMMGSPPPASTQGDMSLPAPGPGHVEPSYDQSGSAANNGGMLLPPPGPGHVEPAYNQPGSSTNTGGMLLPPPGPGTTEPANGTTTPNAPNQ